jgi:thiol-disulfide isomerase/thioredoxin
VTCHDPATVVRRARQTSLALASVLACGIATHEPAGVEPDAQSSITARAGAELVGHAATELLVDAWLADDRVPGPTSLASLRGSVVVVRFWTDTCPYCRASAPAFVELDRDFRDRGLVVLGLYHPKPRPNAAIDPATLEDRVARVADEYGFRFAIGLDLQWRTIDAWWLQTGDRDATSATFVIDRAGVIRGVHPGPELHPGGPDDHAACRADYAELRALVESQLKDQL